jgi:hypothetical protein
MTRRAYTITITGAASGCILGDIRSQTMLLCEYENPDNDGELTDEQREAAERRMDEEADAAYDRWAEENRASDGRLL